MPSICCVRCLRKVSCNYICRVLHLFKSLEWEQNADVLAAWKLRSIRISYSVLLVWTIALLADLIIRWTGRSRPTHSHNLEISNLEGLIQLRVRRATTPCETEEASELAWLCHVSNRMHLRAGSDTTGTTVKRQVRGCVAFRLFCIVFHVASQWLPVIVCHKGAVVWQDRDRDFAYRVFDFTAGKGATIYLNWSKLFMYLYRC